MKTENIKKGKESLPEDEEFEDDLDGDFVKETEKFFDNIWKELKEDAKGLSKRELARQMFVSGALMCRESFERNMQELSKNMEKNPEKIKELLKEFQPSNGNVENEENELWEEGYFAETTDPIDMKKRMRTFHMKHDEEMNYNCKKCDKKISAHNKDWHNGMCDDCFNKTYYKND